VACRLTGALLDTTVLIASDPRGVDLPASAAISVVSLGELHAGVQLARTREAREGRTARLDAVRAVFAPLPVDEAVAERYGELLAIARRTGRTAKATDLLIAATAGATGRTFYTLDRTQARLARAAGLPVSGARG
jgi:toxin FitB